MSSATLLRGSASTRAGSFSRPVASASSSAGRVAEKSICCRASGIAFISHWISGQNPISSRRSASSSTRVRSWLSVSNCWPSRSRSRPGVATSSCGPSASSACCCACSTPPHRVTSRRPSPAAGPCNASLTCAASSRVGTSTSPCTPSRAGSSRCSSGKPNARVLPLPVRASASRSRPASAAGIASCCTRVGC